MSLAGAARATAPARTAAPARTGATSRDWERLIVTVLMAAVTSPGVMLLGASDALDAPESPIMRVYWLPIYAAILGLCAWRGLRILQFVFPAMLAGVIVAWAWASKDWSVLPDVSSRRAMALAFTTLLGIYLGAVWGGRKLPEMLADVFLWISVGSIVAAVAIPSIGIQHDGETSGAWRGLYPHKNMLGSWMALGSLSAASAAFTDPEHRRRRLVTLALCTFLLLMCRSKGMLLVWLEVMGAAAVFALARRGPVWTVASIWIAGAVGTAAGLMLALDPGAILTALGKNATLSGRTDVWASVMRRLQENPWFGYGYAAFWEKGSIPAEVVKKETGWLVPAAHNGWLDLLLQVGWIGTVFLILVMVVTLVGCIVRSRARVDGYFGILFLIDYVANASSESVLEVHNSLPWALFIAVACFALGPAPEKPVEPRRERASKAPAFDWATLDASTPPGRA